MIRNKHTLKYLPRILAILGIVLLIQLMKGHAEGSVRHMASHKHTAMAGAQMGGES